MSPDSAPGVAHEGGVLLCFDGSDDAQRAIAGAGKLLAQSTGHVLCVWQPAADLTPLDLVGDLVGRASGIYGEWDALSAELADGQAAEGVAIARRAGFDVAPLTARGKPWVEIVRVAEAREVSAVVLGARGLSRLSSLALGSVCTQVLHHCQRPVLVIPRASPAATAP